MLAGLHNDEDKTRMQKKKGKSARRVLTDEDDGVFINEVEEDDEEKEEDEVPDLDEDMGSDGEGDFDLRPIGDKLDARAMERQENRLKRMVARSGQDVDLDDVSRPVHLQERVVPDAKFQKYKMLMEKKKQKDAQLAALAKGGEGEEEMESDGEEVERINKMVYEKKTQFLQDRNVSTNPVVGVPKDFFSPQQVLCMVADRSHYAELNMTDAPVGKCALNNASAKAFKALMFFLFGVYHDIVRGLGKEKPPKDKKKKKKKDGDDEDEEDNNMYEALFAAATDAAEMEATKSAPRDSFTLAYDEEAAETFIQKTFSDEDDKFPVPKVAIVFEVLLSDEVKVTGVRMFFMVFDDSIDIDKACVDYMRRNQSDYDKWSKANREAETSGKRVDGKPFARVSDTSCMKRIMNERSWMEVICDYYGSLHPVTKQLQQGQSDVLNKLNPMFSRKNIARPTAVLGLENAFTASPVGTCAVQQEMDNYQDKRGGLRSWPIPFGTFWHNAQDVEPKGMHDKRWPSSLYFEQYLEYMEGKRLDYPNREFNVACTDADFKEVMLLCRENDPLVQARLAMADIRTDPSVSTTEDERVSLDMILQLAPRLKEKRTRIETTWEEGTPEYMQKMQEFKRNAMQTVWGEIFDFEKYKRCMSPVYIAATKRVLETPVARQWPDFMMAAENLDPHGNVLLMLFMRMSYHYRVKEGGSQRDAILHYLASLTSLHFHRDIKMNLISVDSNSTGKSFRLKLVQRLLLDGTVMSMSHMTENALNVEGNYNMQTIIMEECPTEWLGMSGGKSVDSPIGRHMKNLLTSQESITYQCVRNSETGERMMTRHVCSRICSAQVALNHQVTSITSGSGETNAELSRFMPEGKFTPYKSQVELRHLVAKLADEEDIAAVNDFEDQMHMIHAYCILVNMMIGFGILHPVNKDLGAIVLRMMADELPGLGGNKISTRFMEMTQELMVAICVWCGVTVMMGTEFGFSRRWKEGRYQKFNPDILLDIEPLLVVNMQHIVFALTLLEPQMIPNTRKQVLEGLARLRHEYRVEPYRYEKGKKNDVYEDPRYAVIHIPTEEIFAEHIARDASSDLTTSTVIAELRQLRKTPRSGEGVIEVRVKDDGLDIPPEEIVHDGVEQVTSKWTDKIIKSATGTLGLRNAKYNGSIAVLNEVLEMYDGRKGDSENEGADSPIIRIIKKNFNYRTTVPRRLLTAEVLRNPKTGEVIQRAPGFMDLEPDPNKSFVYERKTCLGHEHSATVDNGLRNHATSDEMSNARRPVMVFPQDADLVMMIRKMTLIGRPVEEARFWAPWNLSNVRNSNRAAHAHLFEAKKDNIYKNYPECYIQRSLKMEQIVKDAMAKDWSDKEVRAALKNRDTASYIFACKSFIKFYEAMEPEKKRKNGPIDAADVVSQRKTKRKKINAPVISKEWKSSASDCPIALRETNKKAEEN